MEERARATWLAAWLREVRRREGLAVDEAARRAGVGPRSWARWEAGEMPSGQQLARVIWEFGSPPFPTKQTGYFLRPAPDLRRSSGARLPTRTDGPKLRQMA